MQYFIRPFKKIGDDTMIGPYEHLEVVDLVNKLRAKGLEFFVADKVGVVVIKETAIRTSRFE
jgi:hypothetical protein